MNIQMPEPVERAFWKVAIPALSHNIFIQKSIRAVHTITHEPEYLQTVTYLFVGALAGFLCGVIAYILSIP